MTLKMLILGLLQGLTEFLPVSSSGHLVLGQELLRFRQAGVAGAAFLHLGTLAALLAFFAPKIWEIITSAVGRDRQRRIDAWRLVGFIAVGSVPAALVGLLGSSVIQRIFAEPTYVSFFLLGTGALLVATRWRRKTHHALGISDAIIIGLAQAVAILPGFSRSGLTIGTALLLGIAEEEAFRFSFLLSIPAVAAANLLLMSDITSIGSPVVLIVGFLASLGAGLLALWLLRKVVVSKKFWLFSFYCFAVGTASLIFLILR